MQEERTLIRLNDGERKFFGRGRLHEFGHGSLHTKETAELALAARSREGNPCHSGDATFEDVDAQRTTQRKGKAPRKFHPSNLRPSLADRG